MSDDDYEVGYGKPPRATRFQPGQSGNPAGRKKGSKNLASLIRDAMHETVVITLNGRKKTVPKIEAAFIQQANRAAGGDAKAMKLMVDLMVGTEAREALREPDDEAGAKQRRERQDLIIAAMKARLNAEGGEDAGEG